MAAGDGSNGFQTRNSPVMVNPFDGTVGTNFVERRTVFERAG